MANWGLIILNSFVKSIKLKKWWFLIVKKKKIFFLKNNNYKFFLLENVIWTVAEAVLLLFKASILSNNFKFCLFKSLDLQNLLIEIIKLVKNLIKLNVKKA